MKSTTNTQIKPRFARGLVTALLATTILSLGAASPVYAGDIVAPDAEYNGKSYAEWSARWFEWVMEYPVQDKDGNPLPHPSFDDANVDVRDRQSGDVWFLSGPFVGEDGLPDERSCTIPEQKALFIGLVAVECSSVEPPESGFHGDTEAEQRECANYWANHIVPASLFLEVDGQSVTDLASFRAVSPQFKFKAPTPWFFGETGGKSTSVSDGYFVLLEPLPKGEHTIHYGGSFLFTLAEDGFDAELTVDMTYHVTVE